ncbi:MAG: TonB-dependent receptor [Chlorobi bacterium]|nr:TonB-dependent receptor [Chlorobiota bacterium]
MKTKHAQVYPLVRFVLSAFCLLALLVPLPCYAADTGTVKGKVIDKADGEGVYGASVTVAGTTIGTATDMNGNFTISGVPAKQQKISVSIVGYSPASQVVSVGAGQTSVVNLSLGQTTIMASEVVVGAALYKQDRLEVPVTANVVSAEKIKQEPNPTLDQVVEDVPGVVVTRAGGQTTSTLQIRGSNTYQGGAIGTRVQGFYDGFPLNSPETGEVVWSSVNMNAADKVEVLKGSAATLYGSGAMGGVVNVFGHLPETLEVKAGTSAGFYDAPPSSDKSVYRDGYTPWFWNSYVGIGNKSGKLSYSLLYSHSEDDGYRQNAQTLLNDVKLKARYDIDAKQYLQLSAFYNETEGGYAYTWPYDATVQTGTFIPHPELAYDVYVNARFPAAGPYTKYDVYTDDLIKRKNALAGLNYVNLLSDNLTLDARLYYTRNATTYEYNNTPKDQMYATGATRYPGEFNETSSNRYGAGVKLDWRVSDSHRLFFGVDGNIIDVQSTQYTGEIPSAHPLSNSDLNDIQEKNFAAFVQDEWKLTDKLTALLSLRYDWSGIDADEVTYVDYRSPVYVTIPGVGTVATYPYTKTESIENPSVDAISPRIALNYKATDDMSFRASWGTSFRAPTLAERFVRDAGILKGVPNPALDKETMTAYEIGVYKQFGDKVSLDVAAFINDYDNLIESVKLQGTTFEFQNITKARIWGIETSLNIRPNPSWNVNLAYTYMNAKNTDYKPSTPAVAIDSNPDPEWLPMRPEHTASASVTWKANDNLTLNLNGRYVGEYKAVNLYTNTEGDNYPGDFVVFNLGAKYKITDNIGATLLCNNIGNVQYEEAEWFRAPGRSFVLGVDLTY